MSISPGAWPHPCHQEGQHQHRDFQGHGFHNEVDMLFKMEEAIPSFKTTQSELTNSFPSFLSKPVFDLTAVIAKRNMTRPGVDKVKPKGLFKYCLLGCCLFFKNASNFKHIQSCASFTVTSRKTLDFMIICMGKSTPRICLFRG